MTLYVVIIVITRSEQTQSSVLILLTFWRTLFCVYIVNSLGPEAYDTTYASTLSWMQEPPTVQQGATCT